VLLSLDRAYLKIFTLRVARLPGVPPTSCGVTSLSVEIEAEHARWTTFMCDGDESGQSSALRRLAKRFATSKGGREDGEDEILCTSSNDAATIEVARGFVNGERAEDASMILDRLSDLLERLRQKMATVHHTAVERRWRRVYTDAALLKCMVAVAQAECGNAKHDSESITQAIRDADLAIVIAGAPGEDRLEMLQDAIRMAQIHLDVPLDSSNKNRATQITLQQASLSHCRAMSTLTCLPRLPDLSAFQFKLSQRPFIVKQGALHWPLFEQRHGRIEAKWSDANYLRSIAGPGRVVPVEIGKSYEDETWSQAILPFEAFLDHCRWGASDESDNETRLNDLHYLAQHDLFTQLPELRADVIPFDLVYAAPSAPSSFPQYRPPMDDEQGTETVLMNAWMGPKGTLTPIHRDPYFNFFGECNVRLRRAAANLDNSPSRGLQAGLDRRTNTLRGRCKDESKVGRCLLLRGLANRRSNCLTISTYTSWSR
jgi:hypothetical protein